MPATGMTKIVQTGKGSTPSQEIRRVSVVALIMITITLRTMSKVSAQMMGPAENTHQFMMVSPMEGEGTLLTGIQVIETLERTTLVEAGATLTATPVRQRNWSVGKKLKIDILMLVTTIGMMIVALVGAASKLQGIVPAVTL